jgi:hypothetical protein
MNFLETACNLDTKTSTGIITYLDFTSYPDSEKPYDNWGSRSQGGEYGVLSLSTFSKFVELETFRVTSKMNQELEKDLSYFHGVDASSMMIPVLENEAAIQRYKKLSDVYNKLAEESQEEILKESKWKRFLVKLFPNLKFPLYTNNDSIEGSKILINSIIIRSNLIVTRSRRGPGDFVICSGFTGALIQDHPSFVYNEGDLRITSLSSQIRFIGTIAGRIGVFIDPNKRFEDNTIIVGRRTKENEPGVYIVENKDAKETQEIIDPVSFNKTIAFMEKLAFVGVGNANRNFLKFEVLFTKKPLWRKILSI